MKSNSAPDSNPDSGQGLQITGVNLPMPEIPISPSLACDPPLQRRAFLQLLGGTGVAGAVLSKLPSISPSTTESADPTSRPLSQLTLEMFGAVAGSSFEFTLQQGTTQAGILKEVQRLGGSTLGPSVRAPFSLLFEVQSDTPLSQRTYPLRHHELGDLAMFLVPLRNEGNRWTLEAVFT